MPITRKILFLGLLAVPVVSTAHHAVAGRYDPTKTIEVEGVVTSLLWRNPHVQVSMRVIGENEIAQDWSMATTSLSNMRRWQIGSDFIEVGDAIRVAGNPARIGQGLYIYNVLTSDGDEVLLGSAVQPRWTDQTIEMSASRRLGVGNASAPELGIFRVWSTPDNIPMLIPRDIGRTPSGRANLTETALSAVDAFIWERDNPLQDCMKKGMPLIMEAPYPFVFTQDGENIYWHNEEYDTIRTIRMEPNVLSEGQPDSLLGYSIGRWENERTLAVTTTHMDWGHFDGQGIPASTAGVSVEHFTLSELGERLDYSMTFSDPENLIEPMTFRKYWVWYPDAEVNEYACSRQAED